jgi:hypothetical protein
MSAMAFNRENEVLVRERTPNIIVWLPYLGGGVGDVLVLLRL